VILELELDGMKKENAELKYQCSELENDNKLLRTEIKTKEREKTELHNRYKVNTPYLFLNLSTNSESSYIIYIR